MASLMEKLASNSTIKSTAPIMDSKVFGAKEMAQTSVPMVNVALSGRVDGGITPGLLMLAGPSKHFKSAFALLMAAAHQKKHKDGVEVSITRDSPTQNHEELLNMLKGQFG